MGTVCAIEQKNYLNVYELPPHLNLQNKGYFKKKGHELNKKEKRLKVDFQKQVIGLIKLPSILNFQNEQSLSCQTARLLPPKTKKYSWFCSRSV